MFSGILVLFLILMLHGYYLYGCPKKLRCSNIMEITLRLSLYITYEMILQYICNIVLASAVRI